MDLWRLFKGISSPNTASRSLYLPLPPRAKNSIFRQIEFPDSIFHDLIVGTVEVLFPFLVEKRGSPETSEEFDKIVRQMANDRDFVFYTPTTFFRHDPTTSEDKQVQIRMEHGFAQLLLKRVISLVDFARLPNVTPYNFLIDLVLQAAQNAPRFQIRRDELGYYWLILRDAVPYRDNSFFVDVTILIQSIGNIVRVIIAEKEEDIDSWYRYEWLSLHMKDIQLKRLKSPKAG
jgi:hypothetical protein